MTETKTQSPQTNVVGWVAEGDLPKDYPKDVMLPYSKMHGVRIFPIFAPPRQVLADIDTLALETVRELSSHLRLSDIQRDGQMTAKWQAIIARALVSVVATPSLDWLNMADAPKDGTMLRLLVVPDQEEFTAFDDSLTPYETIGSNNLSDTQDDRWEFAGWDWQQDCFITGRGEVIGWRPLKAAAPSHLEELIRWCLDRDERNGARRSCHQGEAAVTATGKPEYDSIWLEPREGTDPYIGRRWCQDNQWGEEGIEYVRADPAPAPRVWTQDDAERENSAFHEWFKERGYPSYPDLYPLTTESAMHSAWQEAAKRAVITPATKVPFKTHPTNPS